ncbi:hypothetical protein [Nocardia sp. NPDC047038]|uniref:hypothetical protein n=1 Tax=Nocardia sp. NPDC047038 TaxID=3154338 RepID=UPI0033D636D7
MRYNIRAAGVAAGFGALFLDVGQEFVRVVAEMLGDWRLSAPHRPAAETLWSDGPFHSYLFGV